MRPSIVLTRPGRVPAMLAVLILVLMAASAMRLYVPGVREATRGRSVVAKVQARVDESRRRSNERERSTQGPGRSLKALIFRALRAALPRAPLALHVRPGTEPGAYALGTSIPRSQRWKALGGHGRNGPGATS